PLTNTVALPEAGRGGENALGSRKSIGISSLACCELWLKMGVSPIDSRARSCHAMVTRCQK
ncbi:MAG: hypothetical protein WCK15_22165, partial [Pirellula sp.]